MNEIKKMFEHWRKFLEGTVLTETLSDKSLESDVTHAKTFIDLFITSNETAILALQMIQKAITDYEGLKILDIDSDSYREKADGILKDPNAVVEDKIIDKYITELKNIEIQIKTEYNL